MRNFNDWTVKILIIHFINPYHVEYFHVLHSSQFPLNHSGLILEKFKLMAIIAGHSGRMVDLRLRCRWFN